MLNGLALTGEGTFSDGARDKDDEFLDAGSLEITETTYIGSVGKYYRVGPFLALDYQQRCDLHLLCVLCLYLKLSLYLCVCSNRKIEWRIREFESPEREKLVRKAKKNKMVSLRRQWDLVRLRLFSEFAI